MEYHWLQRKNEQNGKVNRLKSNKRWIIKTEIIDYSKLSLDEVNKILENNITKYNDKDREDKLKKKNRETISEPIEMKCRSKPIEKEPVSGEVPQTEIKKKKKKKAKESLTLSNEDSKNKKKSSSKKSKSKAASQSEQLTILNSIQKNQ